MKLAILFWFYKEPDICENRLRLLKQYNPDLKIYGLFGGEQSEADSYRERLGGYLDDLFVSPSTDPDWKWIHGDLMILEWFALRGGGLEWDSIAVVQWDMLVLDSLSALFSGLKEGEMVLSGYRELDQEIERKWSWTKEGGDDRHEYLSFREHVKREYGYERTLPCCLFIFEIFPRIFFEKYLTVSDRTVGMLEYKVPTYARIFGIPVCERDLGVWWFEPEEIGERMPMNAVPSAIPEETIRHESRKPDGFRIFHPYFKEWLAGD
ncbi:MAG TPA: hypothetical protein VN420_00675 [Candidatus Fimivivens sp.]|nr:hypothetical protein [Candidatus Fimivivens sp.]